VNDLSTKEILDRATDLLRRPTAETAGLWPRASAVLARQALERGLIESLSPKVPGIERANVRAQLLCLQAFLENREVAHEVNLAWWALTRACHHLSYELPPTAPELETWIGVVDRFLKTT
jgi:hypothetical protein